MAQTTAQPTDTNSLNANRYKPLNPVRMHLFTLMAAFTGVVIGVLASVGFVASYLHDQLAQQTASLNHQIVQLHDAALYGSSGVCVGPSSTPGSGSSGFVTTAAVGTSGSSAPGKGGGGGSTGSTTFIKKLVGGVYTHQTATISNTGPDSTNTVSFKTSNKTTVNNTNNLSYTSVNNQTATSGNAEVEDNTSGGNATTGNAANTNVNNVSYKVTN